MDDNKEVLNQLLKKLDTLLARQEAFSKEVDTIKNEIYRLQYSKTETVKENIEKKIEVEDNIEENEPLIIDDFDLDEVEILVEKQQPIKPILPKVKEELKQEFKVKESKGKNIKPENTPARSSNLEKFIGENLISKIGILITVIGVAIGAKYSIDNELISPMTRVILGYVLGLGLLIFGITLKNKYENYSAVLVSGAMATMYLITFSAYSFYDLFPQTIAFGLMVFFTIFTVIAAINYNKQVIAHIGLVGAYAVPFLLSNDSGNVVILFSYMAIINLGILVIAFIKYWKPLYYTAFFFTWLIYAAWFFDSGPNNTENFGTAALFLSIFFITFYSISLSYKLIKKEQFKIGNIILVLLNSFIFYGFGFLLLDNYRFDGEYPLQQYLGLFTLGNAVIHFIVSAIIYKQKLGDRNLFYLISGLVMVFITIAIPVQLDGNWVTLLWITQAALLFWIGKTKKIKAYEFISYPLMVLAGMSLVEDWGNAFDYYSYGEEMVETTTPFFNINFLSSVLFIAALGFISFIARKNNTVDSSLQNGGSIQNLLSFFINIALLGTIYFAFCIEIFSYFEQLYSASMAKSHNSESDYSYFIYDEDVRKFQILWIFNFSLLFLTILSFINILKIKNRLLGIFNLLFNIIALLCFMAAGLFTLSLLRDNYLSQEMAEYYDRGNFHILIRYISLAFVIGLLFASYRYSKQEFMKMNLSIPFDLILSISTLWIVSSEIVYWMVMADSSQSHKLGLSIFWGIFSLILIGLGIWKGKKHLRIFAMILFTITLIKLFVYDISHLDTISKTIVFISLGILLLIISFLYNKYKHIISDEAQN